MATPKKRSKLSLLLALLRQNRGEVSDRLLTFADFQTDRFRRKASMTHASPTECRRRLGGALHGNLDAFLHEAALLEIERQVTEGRRIPSANPVFGINLDGAMSQASLCYAVDRLPNPDV